MEPVKRRTHGTIQNQHENRIQTLERRIPVDYPLWESTLMDQIVVSTLGVYPFGWTFPNNGDPDDPEWDDITFTLGDLIFLPVDWNGVFELYMTAAVSGGNNLFGNYRTVVDGGDQDQHGKSHISFLVWVYEGSTQVGLSSNVMFRSFGESPPPTNSYGSHSRVYWNYSVWGGPIILAAGRRVVLEPYYALQENLGGNAQIQGLVFALKRYQDGTGGTGFSG